MTTTAFDDQFSAEPADAKPRIVAWYAPTRNGDIALTTSEEDIRDAGWLPLYAAPVAAVPDGYKLVPIEPTQDMCEMAYHAIEGNDPDAANMYRAMLAAAPEVKS